MTCQYEASVCLCTTWRNPAATIRNLAVPVHMAKARDGAHENSPVSGMIAVAHFTCDTLVPAILIPDIFWHILLNPMLQSDRAT